MSKTEQTIKDAIKTLSSIPLGDATPELMQALDLLRQYADHTLDGTADRIAARFPGRKIECIKTLRSEIPGLSLKTAKEAMDRAFDRAGF